MRVSVVDSGPAGTSKARVVDCGCAHVAGLNSEAGAATDSGARAASAARAAMAVRLRRGRVNEGMGMVPALG